MKRRIAVVGVCRISKPVKNENLIVEVYDDLNQLIRTRPIRLPGRPYLRAEVRAEQLAIMKDGEYTGEFEDGVALTAVVISTSKQLDGTMIQLGCFIPTETGLRYFKSRAIIGADPKNRLALDHESIGALSANIGKWMERLSNSQ